MTRNKFTKRNYKYVDEMMIAKVLGNKLYDIRTEKGLSIGQVVLASGVNKNSIRAIEKGNLTCKTINLVKIAIALDISMQELWEGVDYVCQHGELKGRAYHD